MNAKLLPARVAHDPEWLRRFRAEARAASSLNHPHILVVHDFGEFRGRPFIVMEFVEGQTLRARVDASPLAVNEAVSIAMQVASALAASHARGIRPSSRNEAGGAGWYVQVSPMSADESSAARLIVETQSGSAECLMREMAALLHELARTRPFVLFLHDVHWADVSTIDLLGFLAPKLARMRGLVVMGVRVSV